MDFTQLFIINIKFGSQSELWGGKAEEQRKRRKIDRLIAYYDTPVLVNDNWQEDPGY
ncbi:MAG: hypothetical protein HQL53_14190 [Magnetococcales bacterium]|nr:hypothetical protein [Magnetococcales bacterium]